MKLRINWKYCLLVLVDLIIFVYLGFAMTKWNKPDESRKVCIKVEINIEDENENGFLKTAEVKHLLEQKNLYPLSKKVSAINTRDIENLLLHTAFVKTAQCYITDEGYVNISLTQRTPLMRVKAENGDDYYIDDNGGVMPNSQYTSDMIIVTGKISRPFACRYLSILSKVIMDNDLWRNQVEQINVLPDRTIELVPRVGDHIINIGELPNHKDASRRQELVTAFVTNQLHRMELFYRYGLSHAGWNKYSYISLEYGNQVICTRRDVTKHEQPIKVVVQEPKPETQSSASPSTDEKKEETEKKQNSQEKKTTSQVKKTTSQEKKTTSQEKTSTEKKQVKPTSQEKKPADKKPEKSDKDKKKDSQKSAKTSTTKKKQ